MAKARQAILESRALHREDGLVLSLVWYPPGLSQEAHSHAQPSMALLLSGSVAEQAGRSDFELATPSLSVKPHDVRHANRYGRDGALLLSLTIFDPALGEGPCADGWRWMRAPRWLLRDAAWSLSGDEEDHEALAYDLLAASAVLPEGPRTPPPWLGRVRAELLETPDVTVEALARSAGVHRVHLSRTFSACYGESISRFRRRRRMEVALRCAMHEGALPAQAAQDAGFADQSHLARTLRSDLGLSLTQLRRLLSIDVTNVQSPELPNR